MTEQHQAEVVYIGLGSNLDTPLQQIHTALEALAQLPRSSLDDVSPLYQSAPLGPPGQPHYINAVARLTTTLAPETLLDKLQTIEDIQGRVRSERWGARTLDLDILIFGNHLLNTERLTIPHPEIGNREFVLRPLCDLAPDLQLPGGPTVTDLLRACPDHEMTRLDEPATHRLS